MRITPETVTVIIKDNEGMEWTYKIDTAHSARRPELSLDFDTDYGDCYQQMWGDLRLVKNPRRTFRVRLDF